MSSGSSGSSSPGSWTIIGVDCATQEERMGLSRGSLDASGKLTIERVTLGTAGESAAANIAAWFKADAPFLLAFDAPLGWPSMLGQTLAQHQAGDAIEPTADDLFRRRTDRFVHKQIGKTPLEVGADRIARTARAALGLLQDVRKLSGHPVPLAWRQTKDSGVIEVYPAATLITRGLSSLKYKANSAEGRKTRDAILQRLCGEVEISIAHDVLAAMIEDSNLLDAFLCVLAGCDFARGLCPEPEDLAAAKKEGFIWFRGSGQRALRY